MCEISFDDLDGWLAWKLETRKARKAYVCECCGGSIPARAHYVYLSGITADRDPFSERCCLACSAAQDDFEAEHDFGTTTPSYFKQLLRDCFHEDAADHWGRILQAMDTRALARVGVSP